MAVPKALLSSESNEWYSPSIYVEAARRVMRGIELDPASCKFANETVQAERYYTIEQDGLLQSWDCRSMWINPPYGFYKGKSSQGRWVGRLIYEFKAGHVKEAVLLVNAVTDRRWFHLLLEFPICLTLGRVNFYTEEGNKSGPTHGSAFVYLGNRESEFIEIFSEFGAVIPGNTAIRRPPEAEALSIWLDYSEVA